MQIAQPTILGQPIIPTLFYPVAYPYGNIYYLSGVVANPFFLMVSSVSGVSIHSINFVNDVATIPNSGTIEFKIMNVGSGQVTIKNNSPSGTMPYRFLTSTNADVTLNNGGVSNIAYDPYFASFRTF